MGPPIHPPSRPSVLVGTLLRVYPISGAQHSRWHSFPSPIDMGPPNPSSFEAQRPCVSIPFREPRHPRWHSFSFPIDVGPPIHYPSRPSVLVGTLPRVYPFRGLASSLALIPFTIRCRTPPPPQSTLLGSAFFLAHHLVSTHLLEHASIF